MDLTPLHRETADAASPGARFTTYIRGLGSRIQAACNNQDFGMIREIAVQAALAAEDVALTIEYGWDEAQKRRAAVADAAQARLAVAAPPLAPVAVTPGPRGDAPHAGPTDHLRFGQPGGTVVSEGTVDSAGTVESVGTVSARGTAVSAGTPKK